MLKLVPSAGTTPTRRLDLIESILSGPACRPRGMLWRREENKVGKFSKDVSIQYAEVIGLV
jgi:hypothetical protein